MTWGLGAVLSAIACIWISWTMALITIPLAAASLSAPPPLIGLVVALPGVTALLTGAPIALLADALGRRLILRAGSVAGVSSAVTSMTADNITHLAVGACLLGLFLSLTVAPTLAVLAETSTTVAASRVQGYNGAVQGAGALVGALVAGIAFDLASSRAVFGIVAVLLTATLICYVGIPHEPAGVWPSSRSLLMSYARSLRLIAERQPLAMSAILAIIASAILLVMGNAFLPLYLVRVLGWPTAAAGAVLALRSLSLVGGSLLLGYLVSRYGILGTALGAAAVATGTLMPMGWTRDGAMICVLIVIQGLALGPVPGVANLLIASATSREDRALGFTSISFAGQTATIVLPITLGLALGLWGDEALFLTGAVCTSIPLLQLALLVLRDQRRRDQVHAAGM